ITTHVKRRQRSTLTGNTPRNTLSCVCETSLQVHPSLALLNPFVSVNLTRQLFLFAGGSVLCACFLMNPDSPARTSPTQLNRFSFWLRHERTIHSPQRPIGGSLRRLNHRNSSTRP